MGEREVRSYKRGASIVDTRKMIDLRRIWLSYGFVPAGKSMFSKASSKPDRIKVGTLASRTVIQIDRVADSPFLANRF